MKLKTLSMVDMLSHVDSRVELAEHLTVFTGLSESGKSGIMRGLDQALRNRPAGIDLLRHGAKRGSCSEVGVGIETPDDTRHKIVRRRGKSRNEYELDGQPLLAIGREVPEEISSLLKLSPHAFQLQSDGNFMLCERDGEVAKMLSATVGLDEIDAAFAAVNKRKTENDTALRVAQADLDREKADAARYAGLDAAAALAEEATVLTAGHEELVAECAEMEALAADLAAVRPDAKCGVASSALNAALFAAAQHQKVAGELADMERLLAMLEAAPADAPTRAVHALMVEADMTRTDAEDEAAVLGKMEELLGKLDRCAKDIGLIPRRAALLVTQAKVAAEAWESADDDLQAMQALLTKLERLRPGCGDQIRTTEVRCAEASNRRELADKTATEVEGMSELEGKINAVHLQGLVYEREIRNAEAAIEQYKREHPVCPECGAEQEHWHVGGCK